jgi:hypothetical protein
MKRTLILIILASFTFTGWAQVKQTRQVGDFTFVSLGIGGDLYLTQGNKTQVVLEGDEDDLQRITTEVSGNKLRIRSKGSNWGWNFSRIKVYITVKDFSGLSVSGSGDAVSKGLLKGGKVDLSVSGSGDMDIQLEANIVDMGISGSGSISVAGRGNSAELSISGSGKLDAEDFIVENAEVRISGSGSARVHATKELNSRISGSGSIKYAGNPDKVYNKSSGSGSIRKM